MPKVNISEDPLHLSVNGVPVTAATWSAHITHLYRRIYIDPSGGMTAADLVKRWGNEFYARIPIGGEVVGALDIYNGDFIELSFTTPTLDLGAHYQEVAIQLHHQPSASRLSGGVYKFLSVEHPFIGDPEWRFEIASPYWRSEDIQAMRELGMFDALSTTTEATGDDV